MSEQDEQVNTETKINGKKTKEQKSMESVLWDSCNKLRGSVEPAEYKHVILSLIFLKYANDKFAEQQERMIADNKEAFLEMLPFYTKDNVFFVPEMSRWNYLMSQAKQNDIALKIDTALHEIEMKNQSLSGALPDNYYSRLQIDGGVLASLLDKMNNIDMKSERDKDIFGKIYEYFLFHFAMQEGKGKGEYYTPKTVVALLCELIEPYKGIVYDGACGSGGMFVQSMKFIEEHQGNKREISIYGQEYTSATMKLAKMNLAIRGISANLGKKAASTFKDDQHKDLKADYILMNPPFNQKDWREDNELVDDSRWKGYTTPPNSNANYAWVLNVVSKLSQNGVGCLLLANGALSADGIEYEIRKQLIENDLIESVIILPRNMFYSTDISVTVYIFNKNKKARTVVKNGREFKYRDRSNEILLIDLRQKGHPYEKKYTELTESDRGEIVSIYHNWQSTDYETTYANVKELCYSASKTDIISKNYSLVTSKYIQFNRLVETDDFKEQMKNIHLELSALFQEEERSRKDILGVLEEIDRGIKL
jgi:type I restriction enzyme M protein